MIYLINTAFYRNPETKILIEGEETPAYALLYPYTTKRKGSIINITIRKRINDPMLKVGEQIHLFYLQKPEDPNLIGVIEQITYKTHGGKFRNPEAKKNGFCEMVLRVKNSE